MASSSPDRPSPPLVPPDQLRSDPRSLAHTGESACSSSEPVPRSSTLLRRSLPAQTRYYLRPLLLRARVRTHPSHPPVESGSPPFRWFEVPAPPRQERGSSCPWQS